MFLRKLMVLVAPLLLCWLACLLLPLMDQLGFWSNVLKGLLLGVCLALLLPLSGASRRKEPFAVLLWIPALVIAAVIVWQYLHSVVLAESLFVGYMSTQSLRTRR